MANLKTLKALAEEAADEAESLVERAIDSHTRSYVRMRAVWARDAADSCAGKYARDHVAVAREHLSAAKAHLASVA